MVKYKEIVSMILDMLKESSDDSFYTPEHILFLAGRCRSFLLKQRYSSDLKKQIPDSNYQTLCLDLEPSAAVDGLAIGGVYLKTKAEVPTFLPFGTQRIYAPNSYYLGDIAYVSKDRMKYVGCNKWTAQIIYACLGPDNKFYLHSKNPQFQYLKRITVSGLFEDAESASEFECSNASNSDAQCDIMERDFPLEDALITPLIEMVVKELQASDAAPEDKKNDADDKKG